MWALVRQRDGGRKRGGKRGQRLEKGRRGEWRTCWGCHSVWRRFVSPSPPPRLPTPYPAHFPHFPRTFLLEKIRLVHTSEGERNFHIFYLMLAGTSEEEREALHLTPDPRVYHYVNQSSCYERRDGVKDKDLWAELNKAMKVLLWNGCKRLCCGFDLFMRIDSRLCKLLCDTAIARFLQMCFFFCVNFLC